MEEIKNQIDNLESMISDQQNRLISLGDKIDTAERENNEDEAELYRQEYKNISDNIDQITSQLMNIMGRLRNLID